MSKWSVTRMLEEDSYKITASRRYGKETITMCVIVPSQGFEASPIYGTKFMRKSMVKRLNEWNKRFLVDQVCNFIMVVALVVAAICSTVIMVCAFVQWL